MRLLSSLFAIALACNLVFTKLSNAEAIAARHKEGVSHGFMVLRTLEGEVIARGDLIQEVKGDQVISQMIFHFKDGSIHDETTVFSQHDTIRLSTHHLIQKGPSFPHPIEVSIDASKGQVVIRSNKDGKEQLETEHLDIPDDAANGTMLTLLKNISPQAEKTKVSMITTSSKPQRVTLAITPSGQQTFTIGGVVRKATNYTVKVEIGGVKGVVASIVGKQPPDTHIWVLGGRAPTFLRAEGTLYEGGPIWRVELANVEWVGGSADVETPQKSKK